MIREKENCKPSKGKKGAKSFIFKKKKNNNFRRGMMNNIIIFKRCKI